MRFKLSASDDVESRKGKTEGVGRMRERTVRECLPYAVKLKKTRPD